MFVGNIMTVIHMFGLIIFLKIYDFFCLTCSYTLAKLFSHVILFSNLFFFFLIKNIKVLSINTLNISHVHRLLLIEYILKNILVLKRLIF
jgi:hypothetical protein